MGNQRDHHYLLDGLIDSSKSWLLVIMENAPVTVENEDTFVFSLLTVAAINAVIWTVVPLAGEHIQAFYNTAKSTLGLIRTLYKQSIVYLILCFQENKRLK